MKLKTNSILYDWKTAAWMKTGFSLNNRSKGEYAWLTARKQLLPLPKYPVSIYISYAYFEKLFTLNLVTVLLRPQFLTIEKAIYSKILVREKSRGYNFEFACPSKTILLVNSTH